MPNVIALTFADRKKQSQSKTAASNENIPHSPNIEAIMMVAVIILFRELYGHGPAFVRIDSYIDFDGVVRKNVFNPLRPFNQAYSS